MLKITQIIFYNHICVIIYYNFGYLFDIGWILPFTTKYDANLHENMQKNSKKQSKKNTLSVEYTGYTSYRLI